MAKERHWDTGKAQKGYQVMVEGAEKRIIARIPTRIFAQTTSQGGISLQWVLHPSSFAKSIDAGDVEMNFNQTMPYIDNSAPQCALPETAQSLRSDSSSQRKR